MSVEVVQVEPESKTQIVKAESAPFSMIDGIRHTEEDADYHRYAEQLYAQVKNVGKEPKSIYPRILSVSHPWHGVPIGPTCPDVVACIIEIPALSRVKIELDKQSGLFKVDRILHSSVIYPANYGFIPQTYADDNDPLDILVLCQLSCPAGSLIHARPIGLMPMFDGDEADDKVIAVAVNDPEYNIYFDVSELPPFKLLVINQFFNDYKTLERKKVKTFKPLGSGHAKRIINQCVLKYKQIYNL